MKRIAPYFLLFIILGGLSSVQTVKPELNGIKILHEQKLVELRTSALDHMLKLVEILEYLCKHIAKSPIQGKNALCRKISLLRDCIKNISEKNLNDLDEYELATILEINTALIAYISDNITHNTLEKLNNFDISIFPTKAHRAILSPNNNYDSFITEMQLRYKQMYSKIDKVWEQIQELSLSSFNKAVRSFEKTMNDYSITPALKRSWPYALCALYLLRQKKDSDVQAWNNSYISRLKELVGSPQEKQMQVTVNFTQNTTKAEIDAIKENAKTCVVKIANDKNGRNPFGFLGNFGITLVDDPLVKIALTALFVPRIKKDCEDLYQWLSAQWEKAHKIMIGAPA